MSHKKHEYPMYEGYGFSNIFMIIILILIVLQWFRVGGYGIAGAGVPGAPGVGPEPGLLANGGLFIITLFILIACSCFKGMEPAMKEKKCCHHHHH